MTEQQVQSKKIKELEADGYYVLKLIKTNKNGIPDLLALHPDRDILFLDFYKGGSSLYFKYWRDDELFIDSDFTNGATTTQIIYEIFKLTILSNRLTRRREW